MMTATKFLRVQKHCMRLPSARYFFASSTDHTTLLSNATAHCIHQGEGENNNNTYGPRQYILLPHDTSLELGKKVDKLHLARLSANRNIIYGAKVVQRSLGTEKDVCKTLLDMALTDASSNGESPVALASLSGLCKWTFNAIEENEKKEQTSSDSESDAEEIGKIQSILSEWRANDQQTYEAVKAIASGVPRPGHSVVGQGTYRDAEQGWSELAELYVKDGMVGEGELYESKGGKLVAIEHLADTTREGLMDSGGAMAKFEF
jgi:hypothetical protein